MNTAYDHGLDMLSGVEVVEIIPDVEQEAPVVLPSPLANVSDEAWTTFVRVMATAPIDSVSSSNAVGMFEIMPRRLADLGIIKKLKRTTSPEGRTVYTGTFCAPLTSAKFLKSAPDQYRVFSSSMSDYTGKITDGTLKKDPDMSLSGALAILHRAGPRGLEIWASDAEKFSSTVAAYDRAKDLF